MVRAYAAGVERGDHGNDARFMRRDVLSYAKNSGYFRVGDRDAVEAQSEVEASPSDQEFLEALAGSDIVKARTAAPEAIDDRYSAGLMKWNKKLHAFESGLWHLTEQRYQWQREFTKQMADMHIHSIKIQQEKVRDKLTSHTRMQS